MNEIKLFGKGLKCPKDLSDVTTQGNYDSSAAKNLMIVIEKCNNETSTVPCKSE